ncbi:MAG: NAD(+)/NADH kinase [Terriglobia bacterium]
MEIRKIGITSKPRKEDVRVVVPPLLAWLRKRGVEPFVDYETNALLDAKEQALARGEMAAQVDLVVVFGGDGTLLATARALDSKPVPILAVNLGGLGFMTVITRDDLYFTLEMVLRGDFQCDRRVQIRAEIMRRGEAVSSLLALNDVVLNKGAIARILDFDMSVDGKFVSTYKADGLIVSTPTGSTAYSLAAGGPVIVPSVNAFIVTPICAHTLTNRPIVLPDTVTIDITLTGHSESVYLTADGQVAIAVRSGDTMRARKASSFVELVQPANRNYYEILRQKLKWGER